ncbi:MAG: biopolymer transporter ExbD [Pseudobacteriovorax sp.]|nr:biopolymer transporter ExbD [Pseudobacteriovorax sp.]
MAGGINLDEDDGITDINVTPFVDVVLVLLIIFMVTANYINTQAIELDLPKAATGTVTESKNLEFAIDKDSQIFLDGDVVNFEQIAAKIAERKQTQPNVQALIAADQKTPHGTVMKLIDAVRKNGITDFAINVEMEAE